MTYADKHPVRLVGGRLALDLVNTADWSASGQVAHEKIAGARDLEVWLHAIGMQEVSPPATIAAFQNFRRDLRAFLRSNGTEEAASGKAALQAVEPHGPVNTQPLLALAAMSAISILADPRERGRVKTCPGDNCGWMFVDETKNSRRTWCLMETCGNRAKAARHYQKVREERMNS